MQKKSHMATQCTAAADRLEDQETHGDKLACARNAQLEQMTDPKGSQEPVPTIILSSSSDDEAKVKTCCDIDAYVGLIPVSIDASQDYRIQVSDDSKRVSRGSLRSSLKIMHQRQRDGVQSCSTNGTPLCDREKSIDAMSRIPSECSSSNSSSSRCLQSTHRSEDSNSFNSIDNEGSYIFGQENNSINNKLLDNGTKETMVSCNSDTLPPRKASVTARAIVSALSVSDKKKDVVTTSFSNRMEEKNHSGTLDNSLLRNKSRSVNRSRNEVVEVDIKNINHRLTVKSDSSKMHKNSKFKKVGPKLFSQKQPIPRRRVKKLSPTKAGISDLVQLKSQHEQMDWEDVIVHDNRSSVARPKANESSSTTSTGRCGLHISEDNCNLSL